MSERQERSGRWALSPAGQWAVVIALAALSGALGGRLLLPGPSSSASAQTAPPGVAVGGDGLFAVAGQLSRDAYGVYLVDRRNGTICVYRYVGGRTPRLQLAAGRTFVYDVQLDSYNTTPLPKDVAEIVAEAKRLRRVKPTGR